MAPRPELRECGESLDGGLNVVGQADDDWQALNEILSQAGARVFRIGSVRVIGSSIARAEFSVVAPWMDRWTFVYDSGQVEFDDSGPGIQIVRIDDQWYFRVEDWN